MKWNCGAEELSSLDDRVMSCLFLRGGDVLKVLLGAALGPSPGIRTDVLASELLG